MNYQISYLEDNQNIPSNKYMYIKKHLVNGMQNNQSKVLINPNFVKLAHVKPHFNKQFLINQTIHVNPNVLKRSDSEKVQTTVKPHSNPVPNKPIVTTPTKLIRVPQKKTTNTGNTLVNTRTKLVRVPKQDDKSSPRIRRTSIHSKYKIIRHSKMVNNREEKRANIKKLYYIKNRFRIDHRSPIRKLESKSSRRSSVVNRRLNLTLKPKNVYVKYNSKLNKTQYVSINGILYKRSSKSLINVNEKIKSQKVNTTKKHKEQLVTIRGQKYKLDSNHRTLTLIVKKDENVKPNFKTIYLGGLTFKQKEPNVFVKTNSNHKHLLLSQVKQRSIHTLTNKMRKSNIPCPFYRKFGKCKGKEKGTCIRIHNPDQISLCPKFLQGACVVDKCLLSHKLSAEKMPTCKFFLEGVCSKDKCPYLHVKINAKAEICRDFVEGFCKKATECDKRHQYLCPDFEKTGNCMKRKCPYPHGNTVRKHKFSKIASKLQAQYKHNENLSVLQTKVKNHPVSYLKENVGVENNSEAHVANIENLEKAVNIRYYVESMPTVNKELDIENNPGDFEIVDLDLEQGDSISPLKTRPKVGALPSFIPF